MESRSPKEVISHTCTIYCSAHNQQEEGISSAFEKTEADPCLPWQLCTNHRLQPARNRCSLKFMFSIDLSSKTTFPNFVLKPNKSKPLSFVLWICLWFRHCLLVPNCNSLLWPNKPILLIAIK